MKNIVLFVDDEPEVTEALKRTLRAEPYEIVSARSSSEALEILEHTAVDVVLSDERMPGMSGTELLATVRKKWPNVIRIILTGHASLNAAIKAINEGQIYRFLTKPSNAIDLVMTIRQALKQKELLVKANHLLQASKRQSSIISKIQSQNPEINIADRDEDGAIVINDSMEELDPDKLLKEIAEQINKIS